MKFEINPKPNKLTREDINIWVKKNCKKESKITKGSLQDSSEEYFGEKNEQGKKHGLGVYNFTIEIDGVDNKEAGQYYGQFINGKIEGEGVLIGADYTYVGQLKDSLKDGCGTFYLNDGPTLIGDWKDDKMHGNGRIIFPGGGDYTGEWKDDKKNGKGTFIWNNGDKYVGEFKDDTQHGKGTLIYGNGEKYVGEFKDDKKNGKGTITYPDGEKYVGEFKDDNIQGKGTYVWPTVGSYVGEWKDGIKHGQGKMTYASGVIYLGEYKDGNFHGKGTYTYTDGSKYTGELKDGNFHGKGIMTDVDGDKYEGEYKDDKRHGKGIYTYPSGDKYEGEYKDGAKCGQGTYTYADGSKYTGEFKDQNYHGQGTYSYANGDKYVGEFKDDNKDGQGTMVYANGDKYVGEFKDDKRHGKGIYTYPSGDKYEGEYKDGAKCGKGTYTYAIGDKYTGEWKNSKFEGKGTYTWKGNSEYIAEWEYGLHKANGIYIDENKNEHIDITSIYIESPELANKILELSDFKLDFNFKLELLNSSEITEGILDSIGKDCENYKSSLLRKLIALHSKTSKGTIMRLIKDEYRWVREAAAANQVIKEAWIKKLIKEGDRYILKGLLKNSNTGVKEKEKINKLIANKEKYPIQYTEYILGYDGNVWPSEHVIGSVELEQLVDCIVNNDGDWDGWIWDNNWYDFSDYTHTHGLADPPQEIEYPDGSRDYIEIKGEFEEQQSAAQLSEGSWVAEVVSYEKCNGSNWLKYTAELEYEFNVENCTAEYDEDVISYIQYSEPDGLGDVEFESNDDYNTKGKGTDFSLYYDGNEISDLADLISEMKDVNIDVQSEEEVLSYLKENYG